MPKTCVSTVFTEMKKLAGDFLVLVAARDQPHHLALAGAQSVELLVDLNDLPRHRAKRVEDEAGQPGEHCIAVSHTADRVRVRSLALMVLVT